jgi:sec-independent protein translocase protein TatB
MFDIGFWELTVIGVVALLVIGPERLPRVARTAGLWMGRARRFVSSVKADIDRELAADELKKTLAKQAKAESLYDIIEDTGRSIGQQTEDAVNRTDEKPASPPPADKSHDANG